MVFFICQLNRTALQKFLCPHHQGMEIPKKIALKKILKIQVAKTVWISNKFLHKLAKKNYKIQLVKLLIRSIKFPWCLIKRNLQHIKNHNLGPIEKFKIINQIQINQLHFWIWIWQISTNSFHWETHLAKNTIQKHLILPLNRKSKNIQAKKLQILIIQAARKPQILFYMMTGRNNRKISLML